MKAGQFIKLELLFTSMWFLSLAFLMECKAWCDRRFFINTYLVTGPTEKCQYQCTSKPTTKTAFRSQETQREKGCMGGSRIWKHRFNLSCCVTLAVVHFACAFKCIREGYSLGHLCSQLACVYEKGHALSIIIWHSRHHAAQSGWKSREINITTHGVRSHAFHKVVMSSLTLYDFETFIVSRHTSEVWGGLLIAQFQISKWLLIWFYNTNAVISGSLGAHKNSCSTLYWIKTLEINKYVYQQK